jgi:protein-S-isoprenylcysteine O-methyltransferase Ste14
MFTSISSDPAVLSNTLIVLALLFLGYIFLLKEQEPKLNWAAFYSVLYTFITLPIVNYFCVEFGMWNFIGQDVNSIQLPFNIYFLWVVAWCILPIFLLKGRYILLVAALLFWLDILVMPELEKIGILSLHKNWLLGELLLIALVFMPSYFWASCSYNNKCIGVRAFFQVVVMGCAFLIGLPFILQVYGLIDTIQLHSAPFTLQIFIIIVFPSLVAVVDLVSKGEGTPFPYDPTNHLVKTGVYAYCRNPIQWSFALMFIPLSMYYSSYYLLVGALVSIAYSFGVSDYQEYADMEKRFGDDWNEYKRNVPKWRFLWKPTAVPKGEIYFDANCRQCSQISRWFSSKRAINLDIKTSSEFYNNTILQATYIDHNGIEFKSVRAIACCLEHINLAYATLGWFMRMPVINHILQAIIDSMVFEVKGDNCEIE